MDIEEVFSDMKSRALRDETLRAELLDTKKAADPLSSFCGICRRFGYEIYPMEIVEDGESMVAEMKRSTNGGGENSPKLSWEDDPYEMFMEEISNSGHRT